MHMADSKSETIETKGRNQEIGDIVRNALQVAVKGFVVGSSLYAGLELLASISSKRIFHRPGLTVSNILSADLVRFGAFIGTSSASYKLVTSLLQEWQHNHRRDTNAWWIPVVGGMAAGLASGIDEPNRRRTILLYIIARAVGAMIKILNNCGYLPSVPHAPVLSFSILEALLILFVTQRPELLPPTYYKAILHWSIYYTDEKLSTYFRRPGYEFLSCNHLMHLESCHWMAVSDFKNCLYLFTRIYSVLYVIPLLVFKLKKLVTQPRKILTQYITNVVNSALFFSIDSTVVKYLLCLLRNWDSRPPPAPSYIPLTAGAIAGLSIILERPSRQMELVFYSAAQVLHVMWRLLCIKKPLRLDKFPAGSVVLFCLSLMVIMYSYVHEQEALAPLIIKAIDFLIRDQSNQH